MCPWLLVLALPFLVLVNAQMPDCQIARAAWPTVFTNDNGNNCCYQIGLNFKDAQHFQVTCDAKLQITAIKVSDSSIGGLVPDLSSLTSLTTLYLVNNNLVGPVPEFVASLPQFNLNGNCLQSPEALKIVNANGCNAQAPYFAPPLVKPVSPVYTSTGPIPTTTAIVPQMKGIQFIYRLKAMVMTSSAFIPSGCWGNLPSDNAGVSDILQVCETAIIPNFDKSSFKYCLANQATATTAAAPSASAKVRDVGFEKRDLSTSSTVYEAQNAIIQQALELCSVVKAADVVSKTDVPVFSGTGETYKGKLQLSPLPYLTKFLDSYSGLEASLVESVLVVAPGKTVTTAGPSFYGRRGAVYFMLTSSNYKVSITNAIKGSDDMTDPEFSNADGAARFAVILAPGLTQVWYSLTLSLDTKTLLVTVNSGQIVIATASCTCSPGLRRRQSDGSFSLVAGIAPVLNPSTTQTTTTIYTATTATVTAVPTNTPLVIDQYVGAVFNPLFDGYPKCADACTAKFPNLPQYVLDKSIPALNGVCSSLSPASAASFTDCAIMSCKTSRSNDNPNVVESESKAAIAFPQKLNITCKHFLQPEPNITIIPEASVALIKLNTKGLHLFDLGYSFGPNNYDYIPLNLRKRDDLDSLSFSISLPKSCKQITLNAKYNGCVEQLIGPNNCPDVPIAIPHLKINEFNPTLVQNDCSNDKPTPLTSTQAANQVLHIVNDAEKVPSILPKTAANTVPNAIPKVVPDITTSVDDIRTINVQQPTQTIEINQVVAIYTGSVEKVGKKLANIFILVIAMLV
ncbi:hypothetical protein HDU79_000483 [Rhizoclosmatium sp. JEL0117]|nr:hypothetical protein HDU79_000483 [Rhizoclosmatium sp. JEL0117]